MNPETLRGLLDDVGYSEQIHARPPRARRLSVDLKDAADAWEARERILAQQVERNSRLVTAENAIYAELTAANLRLEAAEKALRQIATMTNDMSADGQFTAGDAYYAQHLAAAALAGEETG